MAITAPFKKWLSSVLSKNKIGRSVLIISFFVLTIALPIAFFLLKNISPVQSWYNNSWEYRQSINVGNTGSLKTNYDVLLQVDTAALVSAGKIQSDCDDIRFVDNDDASVLSYWIENGCNTSSTQIWFRIPSLPNGGKTVYMYYGNGAATAGGNTWTGNTLVWYAASCPVGWSRITSADGKLMMGSSSYGLTGGSTSHTHSNVSCTSGVASGVLSGVSGGSSPSTLSTGTHTSLQQSFSTNGSTPPILGMVLCEANSMVVPTNGIGMFDTATPSGWTRITALDGNFPSSQSAYGGTGGAATHTHTMTGSLTTGAGGSNNVTASIPTGGTITTSGNYRIHTFTSSGTFTSPNARNVEVLVVGGGGGGGAGGAASAWVGGGGGGGGVIYNSSYAVSAGIGVTVTIGTGGTRGTCGSGLTDGCPNTGTGTSGTNGGSSVFGTITALGGGGGGLGNGTAGLSGANGGGGGTYFGAGGTGTAGYNGGAGSDCNSPCRAGGGGGAGGAGAGGSTTGAGGIGYNSSISGSSVYYGGGGGGGYYYGYPNNGGNGGGGSGGTGYCVLTGCPDGYPGTANTGGGGGGGVYRGYGGDGGSGIVIVRYLMNGTGGTETTSGGYKIHTFTGNGTFVSPAAMNVEVLMVAGGGGGSTSPYDGNYSLSGGGGGGGGVIYNSSLSISNTSYPVVIGTGGTGATSQLTSITAPTAGNNTTFAGQTAIGGGRGGWTGVTPAGNGGSGGGGGAYSNAGGTGSQGGNGGTGGSASYRSGGGGGGGGAGVAGESGGQGGAGYYSTISGAGVYYAGGGGGGRWNGAGAAGGSGGGGDGGGVGGGGTNGVANKGGGGGGGSYSGSGGNGGSGIVIIRYADQTAGGGSSFASGGHTHSSNGGTSDAVSNLPSYVDMTFASKNAQGISPTNSILMFNQLPPLGWTRFTSLDNKFARGAATPGGTGGADTHTHSITIDVGSPSATISISAGGATSFASGTHTHSCSATSASGSNVPPYYSVIYGKKNDNSSGGVTYSFNAEESNVPVPPTITAAQGLSTTSIRWNFTDNATNETGFKVYDMAGNLKATCVGSNLTYCDETGLSENTQYTRQLKAYNANGDSLTYSSSASRYTLVSAPTIQLNGVTTSTISLQASALVNSGAGSSGWYFDCVGSPCGGGASIGTWVTSANVDSTGLSPNVQYTFRVKARNGDGVETANSSNVSGYTLAVTPNIQITNSDVGEVTLSVSNGVFGSGQSAAFYECTTAPECATTSTWQSTGGEVISGLTPNTSYSFRVKVRNGDGTETSYSALESLTTLAAVPNAPTVSDQNTNSIRVTLSSNQNGNPSNTEYAVRFGAGTQYVNPATGLLQEGEYWATYTQFASTTGINVTGLTEGLGYSFDVKARNSDNVETSFGSSVGGTMPLVPPTFTSGTSSSSSSIRWNFTDNTSNETGFKVYDENDVLKVTCANPNLTYCDETGLSANTSYTRKVIAYNGSTQSAYSGQVTAYTRTNTPIAPTVLFGINDANVTINTNGNPEPTQFSIMVGGSYVQANGTLGVGEVKRTVTEWGTVTVTGLTENTQYSFVVKAENGNQTHQTTSSATTGYTLTSTLPAPTVTGSTTTNVDVEINPSGNPSNTQYAIYHVGTGKFVDYQYTGATTTLVDNPVWATYTQWGGTSGKNVTGFTANTPQEFQVKAKNIDGVEGSYSPSGTGYTFANKSDSPTLTPVSTTVMKVVIDTNSNPANTEYALRFVNSLYINNQTGTSQVSPDFATYAEWGGANGIGVSGLSPNNAYSFVVYARNGDGFVATPTFGSSWYTLANVPGIPTVTRISSSSAKVVVNKNGNPNSTNYAILEVNSGKFVQTDGSFGNTEQWATYNQWGNTSGVTLNSLVIGTNYEFRVKARNDQTPTHVETAYSTSSNSYSSLGAPVIGTPTALDATSIRWSFSETLNNEIGFRVLDQNGVQVAQCAGANLTYCDELGLSPDTQYTRKVVAYDANGNGDESATTQAYTLALVPSAPTITMDTNQVALNVKINLNGNNSNSSFAIRESISGYYVNNLGQLQNSPYTGNYAAFGGDNGILVTGLFANALYTFEVQASNNDNVATAFSSSASKYTKTATITAPVITTVNDISQRVKLSTAGNPPSTQYRIREIGLNRFVPKGGGNLTTAVVWGTYAEFGGSLGVIAGGLTANTTYTYEVTVRNGDLVLGNTVLSDATTTYSGRPDSLITTTISTRGINVRLAPKYSSVTERFAIYNTNIQRFLNAQGEFVNEPVWLTYAQWGGTEGINIPSLYPGRAYTFVVKTRNTALFETEFSTGSQSYTNALTPDVPDADPISTTSVKVKIEDPGNDASVQYAIQEVKSKKFVSKNEGNLVDNPSWGTFEEFGGTDGFHVKGLRSASDYEFRVRARNGAGVETSYTTPIEVGTNAIIFNVPGGVEPVLASDESVNVSKFEGSQRGVKSLVVTKEGMPVADLDVNFDSDKDWDNVVIDTSTQDLKAVVKLDPNAGVQGTFTLYVPAEDSVRVRVCPESKSLDEVKSDCQGGVLFEGPFPQLGKVEENSVEVSKQVLEGVKYWVIEGLTGTGAIAEYKEEQPRETTDDGEPEQPAQEEEPGNPLVIDVPVENIVGNISNETVRNVARAVLSEAPKRTVLAMKQVSDAVDNTPVLADLREPELVVVTTAATAATVTVGLAVFAGGFTNIPYLVAQLVIGLLSFLGFVKKSRPYGLVYDSVTKKPIDRAVVRIYNMSERLVWTDVTSAFGTFGANLPIGKYKILVVKPGYKYPSKIVTGPVDYPLEPVYHGESIKFNRRNEFNLVIPMDPIEKKGFAKAWASFVSNSSIAIKIGHILLFLFGLVLAIHTLYKYPSTYNLWALIFYIPALILLIKTTFVKQRSKGMVVDRNGNPIEGVTVTLKEMKFDKYVAKRVTDKNGEYQIIVPNGTYQLGIMDENYRAVRYEGGSSIISRKRKAKELVIDRAIIVKKK